MQIITPFHPTIECHTGNLVIKFLFFFGSPVGVFFATGALGHLAPSYKISPVNNNNNIMLQIRVTLQQVILCF